MERNNNKKKNHFSEKFLKTRTSLRSLQYCQLYFHILSDVKTKKNIKSIQNINPSPKATSSLNNNSSISIRTT